METPKVENNGSNQFVRYIPPPKKRALEEKAKQEAATAAASRSAFDQASVSSSEPIHHQRVVRSRKDFSWKPPEPASSTPQPRKPSAKSVGNPAFFWKNESSQ